MRYLILALCGLMLCFATPSEAQDGYRVKAGDTINVEVLEDVQLNRSLLVLPDGTINFPFAGTIRAGGRTVNQIEAAIRAGIASNFAATPNVFVSVNAVQPPEIIAPGAPAAPETINVYFTGEVNAPGIKPLLPGTTFLQAIAQSGGFTNFAATKRVQLRRSNRLTGEQSVSIINYKALSRGAILSRDVTLQDGDVILVPERRLFE